MDRENKQLAPKKKDAGKNIDYTGLVDSCSENVVSGTECTGLIPTPPEDEQQSDAYLDLYTIPKPSAQEYETDRRTMGKFSGTTGGTGNGEIPQLYTFQKSEPGTWAVGRFRDDGTWEQESIWTTQEEATEHAHILNGGEPPQPGQAKL